MQRALNPKPTDDPHDVLVVAPGVAVMVPTDEELAKLARSLRHPPCPQAPTEANPSPQATVPPVDTTFRPTAVGDVSTPRRQTTGRKAARAFTAVLLLAVGAGAAAIAWESYGDAAEAMIGQWAPQRVLALLPLEKPAQAAQEPAPPAVEATAANAEPAPAGAAAQTTAEGVAPAAAAPSAETAPSLGSMANELANARQEIEQLKATIEDLKASQQQMSQEMAKASDARVSEAKASPEVRPSEARMSEGRPTEPNLRPKMPAHPPRTAAARVRKPMPPPPIQQAATAPVLPQAASPYVPRQVAPPPPQTTGETLTDPELASVPRPPMPVR
jgi:hypothetical protein